ncbi:glycoside hydrolase family 9 protein [Breznakiella homolactica]|uniref:Glycoside hydrolase family 9 protein n=1 Tax=Breznakiella homolactica TaxID=2798577 RepID=A0A7T8BCS6_9SPIR|nr:glycoside hydrolase family 9 protein [Breznakiella homolactica]
MEKDFEQRLMDSFYVHIPLTADEQKTAEHRAANKTVVSSLDLWDGSSMESWSFDGDGECSVSAGGELVLKTWSRADRWPDTEVRADNAAAGAYATFGSYIAKLDVRKYDLSRGNRIRFELYCDCPGLHSPIVRVGFVNNGPVKIPDAYSREGFHAMNLKNHSWNTMYWEIGSIAHDKVEEISFNMHRYGKEPSAGGDDLNFKIKNIRFEKVEVPDVVHGWECQKGTAVFSTAGYSVRGSKTAVANTEEKQFSIIDSATGKAVFQGPVQQASGKHGDFSFLDFTELKSEGSYHIKLGTYESESFRVSETVFEHTAWKLVNFLFCERCGFPVPGKHGTCHIDVTARHDGVSMTYAGGWHDAADVSQQTVQTAEILHALLEAAQPVKHSNRLLYNRMMEEANWGLDFVLRTRFGDGYRATNSGIRRWTDNLIGNMDDCPAVVHNHSFENFICAGVEAYAAECFEESDPILAWQCANAAREDFAFAIERFRSVGLEEPVNHEHATGASISQYYAAACWSAAQVYAVFREDEYAQIIAEFAGKIAECQEKGTDGIPLKGFFYRDATKKSIVHFNHQARDQIFVQALEAACGALPDHPEKPQWESAMALHGKYLKDLMNYTEPYGMIPAGIHAMDEVDDKETFARVQRHVDYDREKENYREQLEKAVPLGNGYFLKTFPVWFSFRGNSAVHLSMGKAASILGVYFGDEELLDIAREQIYWAYGKNPSGQSLIYGDGSNYGQQYTALLGETVGEMPVGIQTRGNEDLPYWPPANIATYREVWTTPPGRWLWIAADLMGAKAGKPK